MNKKILLDILFGYSTFCLIMALTLLRFPKTLNGIEEFKPKHPDYKNKGV